MSGCFAVSLPLVYRDEIPGYATIETNRRTDRQKALIRIVLDYGFNHLEISTDIADLQYDESIFRKNLILPNLRSDVGETTQGERERERERDRERARSCKKKYFLN